MIVLAGRHLDRLPWSRLRPASPLPVWWGMDRIVVFFAFAGVQGTIRVITGSVWAPIGFHLAVQSTEQIFEPHRDRFTVDDLALLQRIALGMVPLALGAWVIQLLCGRAGAGSSRSRL